MIEICRCSRRVSSPPFNQRSASIDGPAAESHPGPIMATFKVWVNGSPVSAAFDQKAVVDERDVTPQLTRTRVVRRTNI